jgi:hypothetical protein
VTDADGSIYVGTIMPAAALSPSVSAARSVPGYENNLGRNANAKSDGTLGAFGGGFGETSQANTAGSSSNAYYAYDTRGGLSASEWLVSFTGTNRTLNQKVVFEGRWVIANPVALPNNLAPGNQIVQSGATNSVLRGQAVLDDRTRLEINATPTPSR